MPPYHYEKIINDVANIYYRRAYNDREKNFWRAAAESTEEAWLSLELLMVHVLAPHVAALLIKEEMSISLEEAQDVYNQSMEFGVEHNLDMRSEKFPVICQVLSEYFENTDSPEPVNNFDEVCLFIDSPKPSSIISTATFD